MRPDGEEQAAWIEHVDKWLAKRKCPYTIQRLIRTSIWGEGYYCGECDCFGFDLRDPRIPD